MMTKIKNEKLKEVNGGVDALVCGTNEQRVTIANTQIVNSLDACERYMIDNTTLGVDVPPACPTGHINSVTDQLEYRTEALKAFKTNKNIAATSIKDLQEPGVKSFIK